VRASISDGGRAAPLRQLTIFPEDIAIPLSAARTLWKLDDLDSEDLAGRSTIWHRSI
jgi:hypothetical protein